MRTQWSRRSGVATAAEGAGTLRSTVVSAPPRSFGVLPLSRRAWWAGCCDAGEGLAPWRCVAGRGKGVSPPRCRRQPRPVESATPVRRAGAASRPQCEGSMQPAAQCGGSMQGAAPARRLVAGPRAGIALRRAPALHPGVPYATLDANNTEQMVSKWMLMVAAVRRWGRSPDRARQPQALAGAGPDEGTSKSGVVMSTQVNDNRYNEADLEEQSDASIEATDRIEPRDWMPE